MTSAAQHTAAVQKSTTPKPPILFWEAQSKKSKKRIKKREKSGWEKKNTGKGREVKKKRERQKVEGLLIEEQLKSRIYMLLLLHNCVRTLTGVYVSWCFPAVFHRQTISHSKQRQKNLPAPPLPLSLPLSLVLCFHPHKKKKNLITRQRSNQDTCVYKSFLYDQDLEIGGKSRHVNAASTMSSSEQP